MVMVPPPFVLKVYKLPALVKCPAGVTEVQVPGVGVASRQDSFFLQPAIDNNSNRKITEWRVLCPNEKLSIIGECFVNQEY